MELPYDSIARWSIAKGARSNARVDAGAQLRPVNRTDVLRVLRLGMGTPVTHPSWRESGRGLRSPKRRARKGLRRTRSNGMATRLTRPSEKRLKAAQSGATIPSAHDLPRAVLGQVRFTARMAAWPRLLSAKLEADRAIVWRGWFVGPPDRAVRRDLPASCKARHGCLRNTPTASSRRRARR